MMNRQKRSKWFEEYVPEEVANSTLFKFKIVAGGQAMEVDMCAGLDIDYSIVPDQLADTPSEFSYWASIYSELKMQVSKLERKIKTRRGQLIDNALKEAAKAQVRITDKQAASIVEADDELNKLESQLLLMEKHTGKMWFMIEAIKMKSENLRSLSGFVKIEMGQSQGQS